MFFNYFSINFLSANISPIVPNSILVEPRVEKLDYLKILNGPPQDISDQLTRLPHFAIYVTRHNISETSPGKFNDFTFKKNSDYFVNHFSTKTTL